MLRALERVLFFIVVLLLSYLVTVRALFMWMEYAPKQVDYLIENVLDGQLDYQNIHIQQNLFGAEVQVEHLSFDSPEFYLGFESLHFDFNFFSPFIYHLALGSQFKLEKGILLVKPKLEATPSNPIFHLSSLQAFFDYNVGALWQNIHIRDFSFGQAGQQPFYVTIHSIKSFRSDNWQQNSDISLFYHQKTLARFSLKSYFKLNMMNEIESGSYHLDTLSPLNMLEIRPFVAKPWLKKIPLGRATLSINGQVLNNKVIRLASQVEMQNLQWPFKIQGLPHSIGFRLETVLNLTQQTFKTPTGSFQIKEMRLDSQYDAGLKPIWFVLNEKGKLKFSAKRISLKPLHPMLQALWVPDLPLPSLSLEKVNGQVDIHTSVIEKLSLKVPNLSWAENEKWPGLSVSNLFIEMENNRWVFKTNSAIQFQTRSLRAKPVSVMLPADGLVFKLESKEGWQTPMQQAVWIEDVLLKFRAKGNFLGYVEAFATLETKRLKSVKALLPYPIMGKELQQWLKTGLVSGEQVVVTLDTKGKLQDFPFKSGGGYFKAQGKVENANIKFQPDWPALTRFTAGLDFTPYNLRVSTDKAMLGEVAVKNVVVDINHLDSKNIALDIKGQALATTQAGLNFLQVSPVAKMIGAKSFLKNQVRASKGIISVTLDKIWVPVYGYDKQSETVQGAVEFIHNDLTLLKQLALTNVSGKLNFTEKSVTANSITGQFLNGTVGMSIKTQHRIASLQLTGVGQLHLDKLLTGKFPWHGSINLPFDKKIPVSMNYQVDIRRLQSSLPAPLNQPFFSQRVKKLTANLLIKKQLSAYVAAAQWGEVDFAIDLKAHPLKLRYLDVLRGGRSLSKVKSGGRVILVLDSFNVDDWLVALERFQKQMPSTDASQLFGHVNWRYSQVNIKKLIFNHNTFLNTKVDWHTEKDRTQTHWEVVSPGKLDFVITQDSALKNTHYKVDLKKLIYKTSDSPQKKPIENLAMAKKKSKLCLQKAPIELPNLSFQGRDIIIDDVLLNKVNFELINKPKQLVLNGLTVGVDAMKGFLKGRYQYNYEDKKSQINVKLESKDVAALTRLFKMKKGFSGEKGVIDAQIAWPGGIRCFDKQLINGGLQFSVQKGMIQDVDEGVARLISLVSLESLARRLELTNVKGVDSGKGLVFNEIKGNAKLKEGVLTLKKMKMIAPAAEAEMTGSINYIQKTLNVKMDVTPAVGGSLATIVALTGVATPLASLVAYLLLKNIPEVNEDLVTYHYNITGPIDKPNIKDKGLALDPIQMQQPSTEEDSILDQ